MLGNLERKWESREMRTALLIDEGDMLEGAVERGDAFLVVAD